MMGKRINDMTKVEELRKKSLEEIVTGDTLSEAKVIERFIFSKEELQAFEQSIREEERESNRKVLQCIIPMAHEHKLIDVFSDGNPKISFEKLPPKLHSLILDNIEDLLID